MISTSKICFDGSEPVPHVTSVVLYVDVDTRWSNVQGGSNHGRLGCKRSPELIGCGGYRTVNWPQSFCSVM